MKNSKNNSKKFECPDEFMINRYVQHQCSQKESKEFEKHLIKCFFCRRKIAFLRLSTPVIEDEKEWGQLPVRLYKKSLKILKDRRKSMHKYIFQFTRGAWKVLCYTGTPIPQPVPASKKDGTILKRSYNLREFQIDIDGNRNEDKTFNIYIKVKKTKQGEPLPSLDIILKDLKRQKILKQFITEGSTSFEGITPGKYSINFVDPKDQLYDITFNLGEE